LVLALAPSVGAASQRFALLELDHMRGPTATPALRLSGGELVSPGLQIWRVPVVATRTLLPGLRRAGLLRTFERERGRHAVGVSRAFAEPLAGIEWWRTTVGADRVTPPGPGVAVTVLDSGLDLTHPEFAGRPNTTALNPQQISNFPDDAHGTAVSSVVGAPENGVGLLGIYPQAVLREWDLDTVSTADSIRGIEAAVHAGPSVINMSYGGTEYSLLEHRALLRAFGTGSILVAAAGNEYDAGNPTEYPASLSHVLTVAATGRNDAGAYFTSSSLAVDLAAPGVDIPVAAPRAASPSGYSVATGTSFAAPLVAGALAWVATRRPELDNTQLFDLVRLAARDVGREGWDEDTGWGILDVPATLTESAPPTDGQEPNDDVDQVVAGGLFAKAREPLTKPLRPKAEFSLRIDSTEDPLDVYRAWIPAKRKLNVRVTPAYGNSNVQLWGPKTKSVLELGAVRRRDLLASSLKLGAATDAVTYRNKTARGIWVYVAIFAGPGTADAGFNGVVTTTR
jgi:subtilase family protein